MLEHLNQQGVTGRLELVLVDRGVSATAARTLGRHHDLGLSRVGWDDKQPVFRPIRHAPGASRSPTVDSDVPAGWRRRSRTPRPRRPAGSRSAASPPRCATFHEHGATAGCHAASSVTAERVVARNESSRGMRHERTLVARKGGKVTPPPAGRLCESGSARATPLVHYLNFVADDSLNLALPPKGRAVRSAVCRTSPTPPIRSLSNPEDAPRPSVVPRCHRLGVFADAVQKGE
jgi:hypothetical protein